MQEIRVAVAAAIIAAPAEDKARARKAISDFRTTYHRSWKIMPKSFRKLLESIETATLLSPLAPK